MEDLIQNAHTLFDERPLLKPRSHDTSDWDSRDNQYLRVLVFDRSFPLVSSALRGSKDCIGLGDVFESRPGCAFLQPSSAVCDVRSLCFSLCR